MGSDILHWITWTLEMAKIG